MDVNEQTQLLAYQEEKIFYNRPEAMADFNYWCKFETFTTDQLVALSLGRNPDQINLEKISRTPEIFDFVKEYKKRYALISSRFGGYVTFSEFIEWTIQQEISLPAELLKWFNRVNKNIAKQNDTNKNSMEIHPRTETTYQNIVAILLDFIEGNIPGIEKHPSYVNDNKLIDAISAYCTGIAGLSQSNLSRKIPECRRTLHPLNK
jgi:hypothetical protein